MTETTHAATEPSSIIDKTMCLSLELRKPGNRRKVSTSQIEVNADKDMLSVSKQLIQSEEFQNIVRLDTTIRVWLYGRSLPSPFRTGTYAIPTGLIQMVEDKLAKYLQQRRELVTVFVQAYPTLVEESQVKLRDLANPTDYKTEDQIATAFQMEWRWFTFQTPDKLQGISKAFFEREKAKAVSAWKEVAEEGKTAIRMGFAELVNHMVDRLSDPKKIFRNTLVSNLKEFFETFPYLNEACPDDELKRLVNRASRLLANVGTDDLRKSQDVRGTIATEMGKIGEKLDGMLTAAPKRRIMMNDAEAHA